jgi:oxygen-independent coproporphyrinogen III oxidase
MNNRGNHNFSTTHTKFVGRFCETPTQPTASDTDVLQFSRGTIGPIRHIYVHIPFCARICPYCAFYKDLLDRSQTERFCEAIVCELKQLVSTHEIFPSTIYFGGGTPTALKVTQLELLLHEFHERLELSPNPPSAGSYFDHALSLEINAPAQVARRPSQLKQLAALRARSGSRLVEWTMEANPGSVSARKAGVLKKFGVNRVSLGVQSWDDKLLRLLGREHDARQAEESFWILRAAGFTNINVDLMFGLPGQTTDQWRKTLERTVALQPEHISTYCLTYEEDTEFFLRQSRGEFRSDPDLEAEFFEMTMSILEGAGYAHYEISNYARPGFESAHNRAYWSGEDYLGVGPSAFSTFGLQRWQNVPDYREYIERVLSGRSPVGSTEFLTEEMKRTEKIALSLRTRYGASADLLSAKPNETDELVALGLLRRSNGSFALTHRGKSLADSVTDALV